MVQDRLTRCIGRCLWIPMLVLTLISVQRSHAQKVDLNGNGSSDVWELIYNAGGLGPNADTDGDGIINRLEAVAGTDPFDPNSVPRITPFAVTKTNITVSISSALGKKYELQ